MAALTLVFLLAYLAGVLAIGFAWRRRAGRDEASYFVADRSLNTFWGFIGLSSLTTGGSTTIALAAFVYIHGLAGLWLDLAGALGLLTLGLFLARRIRREGAVTLPEIIGRYYGPGARLAAAILVLVSEVVWFALLIEATQVVLTGVFGLSPIPAIVGSTAVFILYTSLGGQFAVARTDLLQYGLMVVGIPGIALACTLARAGGRLSALPRQIWSFPVSATLRAGDILALLVLIGLPHLVGSDVYSKLLSCRNEATARRSALLASVSKVVFGFSVALMALAARAMLPAAPAGETLPRAILSFVPAPLSSLVLVALVATMQTSADVVLLSATAVTARDILPRIARRPLPLLAARLLSPFYGALGLLVALAMNRDVLETLKLGYSIFAAGLILPVLAALLGKPFAPPPRGAIAAMVSGGAVAAAGRFFPQWTGHADPVLAGTAVNLIVLLFSVVAARMSRTRTRAPA
jgi:SSS family solute:Na+ symporter